MVQKWRANSWATQAVYTIPSVNSEDHDGNYTVVVTNDFGSVTSEVLNLQVQGSFLTAAGLVAWYPFDGKCFRYVR